ncbi:isocitrate lyase/phosphoenolpyruvate mutase family protein [Microlunatus sp. GCM10028923]|uniref:isocitrate lyase/PEP mutase family protein n=1 Tax=Microlunatus sp. GCM10028923 TaxID=3273400 RepID=UPI00360ACC93
MTGFGDLHRPGDPLVLPNVWDVGTAKLLVRDGFPAIATTSLGIAAGHGLPDGAQLTRRYSVDLVRELRAAALPAFLTCDLEAGFSDDPAEVASLVADLGVDGVNLEDSAEEALVDPQLHAERIAAVKRAAPEVFVNARTDVFWLGAGDLDEAVARARVYVDAGADGIFLPGVDDLSVVEAFVRAVAAPVNVLASARVTVREFAAVGVARISTGSLLYRVAQTAIREAADAVRRSAAVPPAMTYRQVQELNGA